MFSDICIKNVNHKKIKTEDKSVSNKDNFKMCRCFKNTQATSVCLLYFCISYSSIALFLLIHVNYNANSAIALLLVPPLPLLLLLLVNHNATIEPKKEMHPHDLNEMIIDLRSPPKTVSEIQEEQEVQEFQIMTRNEVFILAKYGTLMDLKSPPKTQYEIEDEISITASELYI